jgi:hypothetical protein
MCNIAKGITPTSCEQTLPGVKAQRIWAMNWSDIDSLTYASDGAVVTAITLGAGKYAYKFDAHKNTPQFNEEHQSADNSGDYYNETFSFRVVDDSLETLISARGLLGSELVFVAQKKNGNFYILGTTEGLKLGDGTMHESGAAPGDDNGRMFSFTGIGTNQSPMFRAAGVDSESAALAYLNGLLEPNS